ncbi:uncharacterized protein B0P05DRAFT_169853 [Gilbertella persicaria]|uniref:uncharacterized protein n=1 Tax=Gilbertella persicaria TaxID=101096 RepID=UPI002220F0CB|nr:uncharacterized protein B0P05DRAFT_169853 [Gilbertella persicaria]KAI8094991.1 hypothetical protein B0P05DRAFT_169853 [Gilbertella persicaria]
MQSQINRKKRTFVIDFNLCGAHRKKKHRSSYQENRPAEKYSTWKCFDKDNHILYRTSECPGRGLGSYTHCFIEANTHRVIFLLERNRVVYVLKLRPQCSAVQEHDLVSSHFFYRVHSRRMFWFFFFSTGTEMLTPHVKKEVSYVNIYVRVMISTAGCNSSQEIKMTKVPRKAPSATLPKVNW